MTNEEFNKKWDSDLYEEMVQEANEEIFIQKKNEYISDSFNMFETEGFCDTFESPYDQFKQYNGMPFKVVRRCTDADYDWESLPAWIIEFEGGVQIDALPEEICKIERQ